MKYEDKPKLEHHLKEEKMRHEQSRKHKQEHMKKHSERNFDSQYGGCSYK